MLRRSLVSYTIDKIKRFPRPVRCHEFGIDVVQDPLWNKGLAYPVEERDRLGLRGLIPPVIRTLEDQMNRTLTRMRSLPSDVEKHLYLMELQNRNETLFHRCLCDNIEELAPLVYTPTVGWACQRFGNVFRRPRGMYFSTEDRGHFSTMVQNWPNDDVHVVVVTDGSRILGLGDLGAQGMGIPIGKLALYCAAGGIAPHRVLPVTLDAGTNNEQLLNDPDYIGVRHRRIDGEEYYDMVDEFMWALRSRWREVCVQFEDFETPKAVALLSKYRNTFRVFNDDIQGTGAVVVSAALSASKVLKKPLTEFRILCAGAGGAGIGICGALRAAMVTQGLSDAEAATRFVVTTANGALGGRGGKYGAPNYKPNSTELQSQELHHPWVSSQVEDGTPLLDAINQFKPHILIGVTACGGVFTEPVVRAMAAHNERPVIFPLSNPTSKSECDPTNAYRWSDGRAIVATGSPFPKVVINGREFHTSQCNNMYVFPGLGLAGSVSGLTTYTDRMFHLAAEACANCLTPEEAESGLLFPPLKRIRTVAHAVALALVKEAYEKELTTKVKKFHVREGLSEFVARKMYYPSYVPVYSDAQKL